MMTPVEGQPDVLLHRELVESVPIVGRRLADSLATAAISSVSTDTEPGITVALRTLNEHDALEDFFEDLAEQDYKGEVEVVVVDNESTDGTPDLARRHGAEVRTLPRHNFTYPLSMNMAMEAASLNSVFLTVAHVRLTHRFVLRAASQWLAKENVSGAYGRMLPNTNASYAEKIFPLVLTPRFSRTRLINRAIMGALSGRNSAISKEVWEELGRFDLCYETGGEDLMMARRMLEAGYNIAEDPRLAVHHSHGMGAGAYIPYFFESWYAHNKGPKKLSNSQIRDRTPHIDFT